MAQENETPKCSRNGGGGGGGRGKAIGRPTKGPKPKKVPQRGLGVAQLEKLRIEEEQKKDAAAAAAATKSSHDLHLPQLWNSHELEFEKERFGMDPRLGFLSSLPSESNLIRPHPNWERTQFQQFPFSSMVSAPSAPVPHSSIEPPSNQNYSLSYVPMRPEDKMIGIKRPNPFSLDVPSVPSFNYKPPIFPAPVKASETISCGSGGGFNLDFGNSTLREIPSFSASNSAPNSKKNYNDNANLSGVPPPTLTSCSNSKLKSPSTFLAPHNQGYPYLESLPRQGIKEDQIPPPSGYNQFNQQQQHLYSFFPPAAKVEQIGQTSERFQNSNVVGENLDLNLKL